MNQQAVVGLEEGLTINSIFYTIQGEGPWMGQPAVFIRVAGCVLRCRWCDTDYEHGEVMSVEAVINEVAKYPQCSRVVITGGEPLRCGGVGLLIQRLVEGFWMVQIETSGAVLHPRISASVLDVATVVCSPKTSKINKGLIPYVDAFKYVVEAGKVDWDRDGLPSEGPNEGGAVYRPLVLSGLPEIWVGPCWDSDSDLYTANLTCAINVCKHFGYRLNVQLHKYIQVP